jgi:hypothetical protein
LYFLGQMLIWSDFVNLPDEKINSLQKILDSGYAQMIIGVSAFPTIQMMNQSTNRFDQLMN